MARGHEGYHTPPRGGPWHHGIQNGFLCIVWISIPKCYGWKSIPFQTDQGPDSQSSFLGLRSSLCQRPSSLVCFCSQKPQVIICSCPSTDVSSFVEKYPKIKYAIFDRPHWRQLDLCETSFLLLNGSY
jgi:hypothetical protein